ncbi:MAG: LON peptidase substrate-binding domain-containing protein [Pseudohongiellaceae bacterium]
MLSVDYSRPLLITTFVTRDADSAVNIHLPDWSDSTSSMQHTDRNEIPLFPLKVVVFPGTRLDLQIFERRYIDLVSHCMRTGTGFGICLLRSGEEVIREVGKQTIHRVGTYVDIVDWDQLENGLLGITVQGHAKFIVEDCWQAETGVLQAKIKFSEVDDVEREPIPVDEQYTVLAELLESLATHPMVQQRAQKIDYENLRDLGWRLGELLPIEVEDKQQLLELEDPSQRIQKIEELVAYLANES